MSNHFRSLIVWLSLLTGCQDKASHSSIGVKNRYEAKAEPVFVDSSRESPPVMHKFMITNIGQVPWRLSLKNRSCGCTRVNIVIEMLAAGEFTNVPMEVDIGVITERKVQSALLNTDDPRIPTVEIILEVQTYQVLRTDSVMPIKISTNRRGRH